jgi:catalase
VADGDLYEQIINAANDVYGRHPRTRALHAKGTWCEGTFAASPAAAELCVAPHMQGDPIPALIRFSNASGDPASADAARENRGIAVKLRLPDGGVTDMLGTTSPSFVTRTPEDFLELMRLRKPDPETGHPDMDRIGVFLADHTEAGPAVQSTIGSEPPASFATLAYHSPHAYRLLASDGAGTWIRYHWRPEAGEERIPDAEAKAKGRDYLRQELDQRLRAAPARFTLELQIAGDGDPLDDPTAIWPDERQRIDAGVLEVTAIVEDPETEEHIEVFDPTRVTAGIELSDDPILHARREAYSVSAYRRWARPRPNP